MIKSVFKSVMSREPAGPLTWIVAAGIILRICGALYHGNRVEALPGIADQISYHELALRVLQGHGFSFAVGWWPATPAGQPTAHWSFLYVLYLAGAYALAGPNPLAARLFQAVLAGTLHIVLTWRIGRRLFGARAGLLAAGLACANAYFIYYAGALMTESFYIVSLLWAMDIVTEMADRASSGSDTTKPAPWIRLGLAMGAAVLLRQTALLIAPVIVGWAAWRCAPKMESTGRPGVVLGTRVRLAALALAVMLACIVPWTIRNYYAFGRFVLLNTNSGFAFFWGNHPVHQANFIPILQGDQVTYGSLIPRELNGLNEAELDRALLARGIGFVAADPARYIQLSASRAKEYFRFWPVSYSNTLSNYARPLAFGIMLPFVAAGIFLAVCAKRSLPDYRPEAAPLINLMLLVAFLYTLIHLLSWTLIRYRLPVDAMMMPFCATFLLLIWDRTGAAVRKLAPRPRDAAA